MSRSGYRFPDSENRPPSRQATLNSAIEPVYRVSSIRGPNAFSRWFRLVSPVGSMVLYIVGLPLGASVDVRGSALPVDQRRLYRAGPTLNVHSETNAAVYFIGNNISSRRIPLRNGSNASFPLRCEGFFSFRLRRSFYLSLSLPSPAFFVRFMSSLLDGKS